LLRADDARALSASRCSYSSSFSSSKKTEDEEEDDYEKDLAFGCGRGHHESQKNAGKSPFTHVDMLFSNL
jgi:hypothetical protein